MRITGGSAKGRRLKVPSVGKGQRLRPLNARAKEALFNILQSVVPNCRFLDLFAGTGSVGIEALSRGAELAIFVEHDRRAALTLRQNLLDTGFDDRSEVYVLPVAKAIALLHRKSALFDVIFLGAPYGSPDLEEALVLLGRENLLLPGGVLVAEHRKGYPIQKTYGALTLSRQAVYGDTVLAFFRSAMNCAPM